MLLTECNRKYEENVKKKQTINQIIELINIFA